jgi:hypothetical protein
MSSFSKFLLFSLILFLLPPSIGPAFAQQLPRTELPRAPLAQLRGKSGYIFAGTVTGIKRLANGPRDVATMQVTFRVDQGIRGVRTGQTLAIREWSGLWQAGERYRLGEKVLLFLYRPSKLGLTSPVGGGLGRYALDPTGKIILEPGQISPLVADPLPGVRTPGKNRVSTRDVARAILRSGEE